MAKVGTVELTKRAVDVAGPGAWLWDGGTRGISGLGLRVTPAGCKTFVFRYRNGHGTQRMMKLGRFPALTVDQARELAGECANAVAKGKDPLADGKALRSAPTVADLAGEYLGTHAASKGLAASTLAGARNVLGYALPTIGKLRVAEATKEHVLRARAKVKADGVTAAKANARERAKSLSEAEGAIEATRAALGKAEAEAGKGGRLRMMLGRQEREVQRLTRLASRAEDWAASGRAGIQQSNRLIAVLSAMFSLAIDKGWRNDNPCERMKKEREDERWRNLSENEVARLLSACDEYELEFPDDATAQGAADAIRLLLFTGARLREVLRAEWRQFDLERGMWEKPSAHTKVKRQHRLELDGPALDLLREMHSRRVHARFLFPGDPHKGRAGKQSSKATPALIKPRYDLRRPWARIVELAKLEDVRLHDLRRTMGSFMLSSGAPLAAVGKALGHTQARTTARYAHLAPSVQREGLRLAGEKMRSLRAAPPSSKVVALGR